MCVVLILLGREEKSKRECVCSIDIIGEREEQERRARESVCVVLILLEREKSKRGCVCCSENPFRELRAFQSGSARTRSDADTSKHKKGAGRHADASDDADQCRCVYQKLNGQDCHT